MDPVGGILRMAIYNAKLQQRTSRLRSFAQPERHVPLLGSAAHDSVIHRKLGPNSILLPVVVVQIGRRLLRLSWPRLAADDSSPQVCLIFIL